MLLQNGGCVGEHSAHAGKAVPRTIAAVSTTFALLNIFKSPDDVVVVGFSGVEVAFTRS
jgi:hypothetical protein